MRIDIIRFCILSLILESAFLFASAEITSPFEAIRSHREWMTANTPTPESLSDEELMLNALQIIDLRLQEPEAERILSATARKVPEVLDYLNWCATLDCDTLFHRKRSALKGMSEYLDSKHPGCYAARKIYSEWLKSEALVTDIIPLFDSAIARQQKICSGNASKKETALLLSLRLGKFDHRNVLENCDSQLHYPEMWELEKEVLDLYPVNSTDTVPERIELYCALANIKSLPQEDTKVRMMFPDGFNPFNNGTLYEYIGTYRDYLCNTGFYLEMAQEMSRKIFGDYHPTTVAIAFQLTQFRLFNTTADAELGDVAKNICDIMGMYYPLRSPEPKHARMLKAMADYIFYGNSNISGEADEISGIFRLSYGDRNPYYLNSLALMTTMRLASDPDYHPALLKFEEACDLISASPLEAATWKIFTYGELNHINPKETVGLMQGLKDIYIRDHNGTPASIKLGEQLCNFYRITAFDLDSALEVAKALAEDNKAAFGDRSPQYFMSRRDIFNLTATGNDISELKDIDFLINDVQNKEFNAFRFVLQKLKDTKADYLWNSRRYKEASAVYGELHGGVVNDTTVPYAIRDALCRAYVDPSDNEASRLITQCRVFADTAAIESVPPRLLIDMSEYYRHTGLPEDAVAMLEKSMEAHNYQTNYAMDDEYYDISGNLSELYEATNNRPAASLLIAQDRDNINSQIRSFPSATYINYLLNQYYRALRRNDSYSTFFYLGEVIKSTDRLLSSSSGSKTTQFIIMPSICQALVSLYSEIDRQMKNAASYFESEYFKQYNIDIEKAMEPLKIWQPQLKEGMTQLLREFPDFNPDYRKDPSYTTLLASMAGFYMVCEKDYAKAEEYFLKCQELYTHPIDCKNGFFNLANLMDEAGQKERADLYREQAFEIIEKHPDMMDAQDKMSTLTFRFNKSIEHNEIDKATETARIIYSSNRDMLDGKFQLMSAADQETMLNTFGDPAWALAETLESNPVKLAGEVYDAVVYRTGMQLRSQQETKRLVTEILNQDVKNLADSISFYRSILKTVNITPDRWGKAETQEDYNKMNNLAFKVNYLEQQLLDITKDLRSTANPDITWQMIRDKLTENEAAVEFLFSHSHVMALVLTKGCDSPAAVKLCKWQDLSEALNSLRSKNSASLARKLYNPEYGVDLYSMLWQPLESTLGNARKIYFNAPGILHSIAFNAISTGNGEYLLDRYDLHQLTSTAQLTIPSDNTLPETAALVGNVFFNPAQKAKSQIIPSETGERSVDDDYSLTESMPQQVNDNRGVAREHFRHLPFTASEIEDISKSLGDIEVKTLKGDDASERLFRELCAGGRDVVHLATHGFFLSSEEDAMKVPFMKRFMNAIGSPMQRSGIALADAESTWTGQATPPEDNDGILTASEVAALNLKSTRLVALSACETALGGYNFEGIHGLTRGFKQAGVKSLLVSLWSVNDRSTATFMTAFYRHWIKSGDRHAAYRNAVAAVRTEYPSPFYWAPFIMLD